MAEVPVARRAGHFGADHAVGCVAMFGHRFAFAGAGEGRPAAPAVVLGIAFEQLGPAPGAIKVAVADTGQGIPAEDLEHIFDRFYRVDKGRARTQGGSGLGLSIAKWVAKAHGGDIQVESEVGVGTTFTLRLPAYQPKVAAVSHDDEPTTKTRTNLRLPFRRQDTQS